MTAIEEEIDEVFERRLRYRSRFALVCLVSAPLLIVGVYIWLVTDIVALKKENTRLQKLCVTAGKE
jgi:hypothetical protein